MNSNNMTDEEVKQAVYGNLPNEHCTIMQDMIVDAGCETWQPNAESPSAISKPATAILRVLKQKKGSKMIRDKKVTVRFTEDEKLLVEEFAKTFHMPLAVLLRQLILLPASTVVEDTNNA